MLKKLVSSIFVIFIIASSSFVFAAEKVMVFAASSTTNVLDEIIKLYNSKGGNVSCSYAGSGSLARQIEAEAPASIFISANQEWMDNLDKKGFLEPNTRMNLLGNSLVLIGATDSQISVDFSKNPDLVKLLNGGKIVIGSPESVPAGSYAKESFIRLGMWDKLQKNLAMVENVRVSLAFVSRGEAPLGVVFATDAVADKNVKVIAEFPDDSHGDISYPATIIKGKASAEVNKFYKFLKSNEAVAIYNKYGFSVK